MPRIMSSPEEERRGSPRYPLERLAKILSAKGGSYCIVTDISGGGVRINTFGFDIPDEFSLLLSGDGPAKDGTYTVIWRIGRDVGAKFVSEEIVQLKRAEK
jgi:hypothetical protein